MDSDIIKIAMGEMSMAFEGEVVKAVQKVGIDVDKDKLLEAIQLTEQLVRCRDCSWWDRSVVGHTQGGEDIGDRLCRRHLWWTMETDYCSSGKVKADRKIEPQINADQHVERCRKCKHIEDEYQTPISSDGKCYTYVVCTASECRYEPKTDPQIDRWSEEEHKAFYTFLWNTINPNEMQDYIEMFEGKSEPQPERSNE